MCWFVKKVSIQNEKGTSSNKVGEVFKIVSRYNSSLSRDVYNFEIKRFPKILRIVRVSRTWRGSLGLHGVTWVSPWYPIKIKNSLWVTMNCSERVVHLMIKSESHQVSKLFCRVIWGSYYNVETSRLKRYQRYYFSFIVHF